MRGRVGEGDLDLVFAYGDPFHDGLHDCSAVLLGQVFPSPVEVFGFGDDFLLGEVLDLQEVDLALKAGYLCLKLYLPVLNRLVSRPEASGGDVALAVELEDLISVGLEALRFAQESQFLRHTLAVAEVMVAFEVACRNREGVEFIRPEEILAAAPEQTRSLRLPFRWQVEVQEGGKLHRLGVEPDRVFGLRFDGAPEGRQRAYFFLEADRGTMPVTRQGLDQTSFRRKLLAYRETWRQGLHRTHLGIPNFRVLTVTTSEERQKNLVAACRSLGNGGSLFLFADQAALRRGSILNHEFVNGRTERLRLTTLA